MLKNALWLNLCLFITSTYVYTMDSGSDVNLDSNATVNIDRQFVNVNKHDFRTYNANYYPHKAHNDPEATFGQKLSGSFADGCWQSWESIPSIIGTIVVQTATTLLAKKAVDWFNGVPSDNPTAAEHALDSYARDFMTKIAKFQMERKINGEALKELKQEKKIFENDSEELEKINYREQDLLLQRKLINEKYHELLNSNEAV